MTYFAGAVEAALRRQVYERMLCACGFVAPEYTLAHCPYVNASLFKDQDCGLFWAALQRTRDGTQAALETNTYALACEWREQISSFTDAPDVAQKLTNMAWLTDTVQPINQRLTAAIQGGHADEIHALVEELRATPAPNVDHEGRTFDDIVDEFIALAGTGAYLVRTGIVPLDKLLGGLEKRTLVVLAARPGTGKSALGFQVARNVAAGGNKASYFSLEMDRTSLVMRGACGLAKLSWHLVRKGGLDATQMAVLRTAGQQLKSAVQNRLKLFDEPQTADSIWLSVSKSKPDLVVIDHLGIMSDRNENEVLRLGEITTKLHNMAKAEDCAVLLLCQLNRGVEQRQDKRPVLSDLRASGRIEEDADVVLMLYRADLYNITPQDRGVVPLEVWVRKNRNGINNVLATLQYDLDAQWMYGKGDTQYQGGTP